MLQAPDEITPVTSTRYPTLPEPDNVQLPQADPDAARPAMMIPSVLKPPSMFVLASIQAPPKGTGMLDAARWYSAA